jgi:hypothetical protein
MLDQVARTSREYPVLPGTTEDQGVLWYMSTVLLTAFGFQPQNTSDFLLGGEFPVRCFSLNCSEDTLS